jgi:hypothetical protein
VVTIVLEPSSPDYKRWRDLMLLTFYRYALELHDIVREPTETTRQTWLAIEAQFLDYSESRVLQLDARFRASKHGDLNVSDYCRRMKGMDDDLRVMGEIVTNRHLVLNLLHGLNKRFNHMKIFIK